MPHRFTVTSARGALPRPAAEATTRHDDDRRDFCRGLTVFDSTSNPSVLLAPAARLSADYKIPFASPMDEWGKREGGRLDAMQTARSGSITPRDCPASGFGKKSRSSL
ncbi:hypothetical protein EVAR_69684_1 [Eumeta japonica]|uniref:Uncharacterized protein n=1 Tax=Eumeta variegata TaxID=151549 RepID=A0A4C1SQL0_EUMVA|nr:hypothetical protein EVAR_69684_1 [Eumeta japonica]